MLGGAYVGSVEAVRDFRAALQTFAQEAREAISAYDLELRRTLEWLLDAEPLHWQHEIRRCEDAVTEAKIELERRRHSKLPDGEPPCCMVEQKSLQRARMRKQHAEEKSAAMRKWGFVAQREAVQYRGSANQFTDMLQADLPQAVATLDRVLAALESYAAAGGHPLSAPSLTAGNMPPEDTDTPSSDDAQRTSNVEADATPARTIP